MSSSTTCTYSFNPTKYSRKTDFDSIPIYHILSLRSREAVSNDPKVSLVVLKKNSINWHASIMKRKVVDAQCSRWRKEKNKSRYYARNLRLFPTPNYFQIKL